jgi:N-acetylglucosamine-6-phosphate deacetylase
MLREGSAELQAALAGWHIEGPFLSDEPGFRGAHDSAAMCNPTPGHIEELRECAGTDPVLLTLAPERPGAIQAVALAASLGIKVSLGHTNAPAGVLRQAVQAGATGFTHLGNGCPRELNRHDNILWRVWELEEVTCSLIPDAIHVSPPLFRFMHRMANPSGIYYTTDAMAAAGAPPGRYRLDQLEMEVGADQVVRLPGSPLFAGSALTPIEGVRRAARMLGCSWREVWPRFSEAPARFLGWPPLLQPGAPADFCLLRASGEDRLEIEDVYSGGRRVSHCRRKT